MNTTTIVTPPPVPDAQASDPCVLGWMVGSPPPADKRVRHADGSMYRFPQLRWSFSNTRQLLPSKTISRGSGPLAPLPRADRGDIDSLAFTPLGSSQRMTWGESLSANYTDGIVVLHRGSIVYERYFGALQATGEHAAFSITKSLVGTVAASLVHERLLDPQAPAAQYVPELRNSGFGDATLRQLLDMTCNLQFSEDYTQPEAEVWQHARAGGLLPRPPGYAGPLGFLAFLQGVRKQGSHGQAVAYKTATTDALGWVLQRVTGLPLATLLSQRIWSQLGAERDSCITVDGEGCEFAGGGLNTGLRDLARFGELMRNHGQARGIQVVPSAVVADICQGGNREHFARAGLATLPGWSYRNMWWISHNAHGAFMGRGIHGQALYIDPTAQMVIARYASHPVAGNVGIDPTSLPAWHAMALHLMASS